MNSSNEDRPPPGLRCPICAKAATVDYAPFCSKRCADIDLHRWFAGAYAIPANEDESASPDDDDEES